MFFFRKSKAKPPARKSAAPRARLGVEVLESRLVPYALSGNAWPHPELVTLSFVPDGTIVGANSQGYITSNLFARMNARFGAPAVWQKEILRAAQVWAKQTNLNFALVPDSGSVIGNGSYQQGSPSFGDIRIGGYSMGTGSGAPLALAYQPPPVNNFSVAGDFQFNTSRNWTINGPSTPYDLFSVAMHEFGHVLGLNHSKVTTAAMYANYTGRKTALAADDVNGIRAIYSAGQARSADANDLAAGYSTLALTAGNGTLATATPINPGSPTALLTDLDISSSADVDYYRLIVPAGTTGTMKVRLQSRGLSLLEPYLMIYNAGGQAIAYTDTTGTYGTTLTATVSDVRAGQTYYVRVGADDSDSPFGTGKYALTLNFGDGPSPEVPLPVTLTANGSPLSGGGGQAARVLEEFRANNTTSSSQNSATVAMDAAGNYVVVWRGNQGGNGDIYARRFDVEGNALGGEFRVNTTTTHTQTDPSVAMDALGNFVVVWSSNQSGNYDIYAKRFNALGAAQGSEFRVNTSTADSQKEPEVAIDPDGDFVVVWTSDQDGDDEDETSDGVYAQRYSAAGVKQGGEFRVNTYTADDQDDAAVAMDANGNFVVAWESDGQDGSGEGIYARRYDAGGAARGDEFLVNATTSSKQSTPAVAMDDAGNFVVAWQSNGQDGSGSGVFARRYDAAGVSQGGEFQVNTCTAGAQEFTSSSATSDADNTVAMDAEGNFVITWMSNHQDGSGYGIYAQQFDASGEPLGTEMAVNTTTTQNQLAPAVTMADNGDFVIVWQGNGSGDSDGIHGQRYTVNALAALTLSAHAYSEHGCGCDGHADGCGCPACRTAAGRGRPGPDTPVDPNAVLAILHPGSRSYHSPAEPNSGGPSSRPALPAAPASLFPYLPTGVLDVLFAANAWID